MNDWNEAAHAIFAAALRGVRPDVLLERCDWRSLLRRPLADYDRIIVLGIGKASLAMGGVLERELGGPPAAGVLVVPRGYLRSFPADLPRPSTLDIVEAGHPVPDDGSVRAARRVLAEASDAGPGDLVLVLLSGGGSSLCADFAPGVGLDDARRTFELLLQCGAEIGAVNTVRKQLSRVAGGRLARAIAPAEGLALVLSDVPGDDLHVIASGPTVPCATTREDARGVIERYALWDRLPPSVRAQLGSPADDLAPPGPGDPVFERVRTVLVGGNRDALEAAARQARRLGLETVVAGEPLEGEARLVGRRLAAEVVGTRRHRPTCYLWGGETTVTVTGPGRGGRNQELALAAALALAHAGRDLFLLSGGTDGIDGPTDAAGACVTPDVVPAARLAGLEPLRYLEQNDAYTFFERRGGLLKPGPTHTNVMDVVVALDPGGVGTPGVVG